MVAEYKLWRAQDFLGQHVKCENKAISDCKCNKMLHPIVYTIGDCNERLHPIVENV
jgi:hypothetical protein